MALRIKSRITFDPPVGQYARRFNEVTRAAHLTGGRFWGSRFLPRHFQADASRRYGYAPRTPQYLAGRRKLGKPSLVLSGATRDDAVSSVATGIRAFPSRVRIRLDTPSYVPQRPRRPRMPHMAREIFTVTPGEQTEIERAEKAEAERMLRNMREARTVIIG